MPQTPASKGPTSKGMEGNGKGEEKVKEKEGKRWRERFGPPKNFGVAPPMGGGGVREQRNGAHAGDVC